jgi:hypothetical protein
LKPEWWGSPLVQEEKYQEKPVKREESIIIIIIIIMSLVIDSVENKMRTFCTCKPLWASNFGFALLSIGSA